MYLQSCSCCVYSYVFNKRACAFILFETFMQPCTVLFEPARLLILEVTTLPACLLKPAPFGFFYLYSAKSAEIATKLLQQPRCSNPGHILMKKSLINLMFGAYLLEIHLPCTIIWDSFTLFLYSNMKPYPFIKTCTFIDFRRFFLPTLLL